MKVRVIQESFNWWKIEVKYWYWPWWVYAGIATTEERAIARANLIKHPKIVEIE